MSFLSFQSSSKLMMALLLQDADAGLFSLEKLSAKVKHEKIPGKA